jgi:hypothetical protein
VFIVICGITITLMLAEEGLKLLSLGPDAENDAATE